MIKWLKNIYYNITLKYKILILNVLVILLPLTVLGYFAAGISSDVIIEKAEKSSSRELELIDLNLNTLISSINDYSKVIASNQNLQGYLLSIYKSLEKSGKPDNAIETIDVVKIRPEIVNILSNVIWPNTQIFAARIFIGSQMVYNDSIILSSATVISKDLLDHAFVAQTPVWSDLLELTTVDRKKENVFAVAKLVIDQNLGKKTGTVVLYINENHITKSYVEARPNPANEYYILSSDNRIISSQNKNHLYKKLNEVLKIDSTQIESLERNGRVILDHEDRKLLVSMRIFEKLNWKIISAVSLEEITREQANIQKLIVTIGLLCLIFAFISSYLVSYNISKPLQKIICTMKLIMNGDMNVRAEIDNNKEIGILTRGFNKLMDKIQDLLNDIVAEQKSKQEFEFKLIQSQIKPHFLYNTLETILSLNKLERHQEAMKVTRSLAGFYRLSLSKGNDMIKISDEIQLTKDYLYIQKQRYSNYMDFSVDIDEEINDFFIPKLTLQPLVENSIYHGLKYRDRKGNLEIKGYRDNDRIVLVVTDDGVGISSEKVSFLLSNHPTEEKREDFGLASVDRRIKLLYGDQFGLKIESEVGKFTRVRISIPVLNAKG